MSGPAASSCRIRASIARTFVAWLATSSLVACSGAIAPGDGAGGAAGARAPGAGGSSGGAGVNPLPSNPGDATWQPTAACDPVIARRVTRLSDRHLANAVQDLLALPKSPEFQSGSGNVDAFIPNKASSVTTPVALKLRDLAESLSAAAPAPGSAAVACSGDEPTCARAFIDRFAARAFRRPVQTAERDALMLVYASGRDNYGGHAGGIRLVIEAVLQAPSFVYLLELGTAGGPAGFRLTPYELAAKLSFFLRDGLADDALWTAADTGKLATDDQIAAQVDRLLATDRVKANVARMLLRLFQVDAVLGVTKAPEITAFTPELARSMQAETARFVDDVLWKQGGKLPTLLTSRATSVDKALAALYGVSHPGDASIVPTMLPAAERGGILTQASLLTAHALPAESSVVHRGVFVARELLCFFPPPPAPTDLAAGDEIKKAEPTERARAEKRATIARCSGCHAYFDPLGVTFEHYDTLGRFRSTIATDGGSVAVKSSYEAKTFDVRGVIADGVELGQRLASSGAVRECMARQFASYAVGQRLADEDACTVAGVAKSFTSSGGDLVGLVKSIALWPALRDRREGEAP